MLCNKASGPAIRVPGRIFAGLLPEKNRNRPSGRPKAGCKADFGVFPVAVRPKSRPESRFTARKHYCVTLSSLFRPWHPIWGRIEGQAIFSLLLPWPPIRGRIETQTISSLTGPRLPIRWRSEAQAISSLTGPDPRKRAYRSSNHILRDWARPPIKGAYRSPSHILLVWARAPD